MYKIVAIYEVEKNQHLPYFTFSFNIVLFDKKKETIEILQN